MFKQLISLLSAFLVVSTIASAQIKYERPPELQKKILSEISDYWPQTQAFIENNETLPHKLFLKAYYVETVYDKEKMKEEVDFNTIRELRSEQIMDFLKLINDPTNFEQIEPGTDIAIAKVYFTNENGVFFQVSVSGLWCFGAYDCDIFLGTVKPEKDSIFRNWLNNMEQHDEKVSGEDLHKIKLYERFLPVGIGVYNVWGHHKRYKNKELAYGVQLFATSKVTKANSLGRKLQKEYPNHSIDIHADYDESHMPIYRIIISNMKNKEEASLFKEKIAFSYPGAFLVNLYD